MPGIAPHNASRRAFLRGDRQVRIAHRPPWALTEDAFLDACTRCLACVDACPEHVLGLGAAGFPEVDFTGGGECTFCAECVAACEPKALDQERGARCQWSARIGAGCLAAAGIVCQSCRDACPEQAIAFSLHAAIAVPSLDDSACTGCGACLQVCPPNTIALHARTPT